MRIKICIAMVLISVYIVSNSAFALDVSPSVVDAGLLELNRTYEYSAYIINRDTDIYDLNLSITSRAKYLEGCVDFSPEGFEIVPGVRQEIKIYLNTSACYLSPGVHNLLIIPQISEESTTGVKVVSVPAISLKFMVPGDVEPMLALEEFDMEKSIDEGDTLHISMRVNNTGNVRLSAIPYVEIRKYGALIDTARGTTEVLLEPGSVEDVEFSYSGALQGGNYEAIAFARYFDGNLTNRRTIAFSVVGADVPEEQETEAEIDIPVIFDTVNIGNEDDVFIMTETINTETDYISDEIEEDNLTGDVIIRELTARFVSGNISIFLELENTYDFDVDYIAEFVIIDDDGAYVKTITEKGILGISEIGVIRKSVCPGPYGKYTVRATVKYGDGTFSKTVQKETETSFIAAPTALATKNTGSGLLFVIFAVIVLYVVYSYRSRTSKNGKSPIKDNAIGSISSKYSLIESDINALESKVLGMKNKIRGLM
ncbi:hypothetical protein GQ472_01005 [archaeon]|nr:hypothetical protein [archaeon]